MQVLLKQVVCDKNHTHIQVVTSLGKQFVETVTSYQLIRQVVNYQLSVLTTQLVSLLNVNHTLVKVYTFQLTKPLLPYSIAMAYFHSRRVCHTLCIFDEEINNSVFPHPLGPMTSLINGDCTCASIVSGSDRTMFSLCLRALCCCLVMVRCFVVLVQNAVVCLDPKTLSVTEHICLPQT